MTITCLSTQVYLITELLTGGELLDAVLQRGSYNEADARNCFVQLLRGIEYLHAKCAGPASWHLRTPALNHRQKRTLQMLQSLCTLWKVLKLNQWLHEGMGSRRSGLLIYKKFPLSM